VKLAKTLAEPAVKHRHCAFIKLSVMLQQWKMSTNAIKNQH